MGKAPYQGKKSFGFPERKEWAEVVFLGGKGSVLTSIREVFSRELAGEVESPQGKGPI